MLTQGRGVFEAMQTGIRVFTGPTINREIDNANILTRHRAKFFPFLQSFRPLSIRLWKTAGLATGRLCAAWLGPHALLALAVGQHVNRLGNGVGCGLPAFIHDQQAVIVLNCGMLDSVVRTAPLPHKPLVFIASAKTTRQQSQRRLAC